MNNFANTVTSAKLGQTHIFSVGQAGYIIKSKSGQIFGLDLYLSECVERDENSVGFKRLLPSLLSPTELIFDCLVTTHPHYDHFDVDAIPFLIANTKTKLFASIDCEKEVAKLQIHNQNITYVKPLDHFVCGDFDLNFVNCDHGLGAPDAFGLVLTVDGKKIYFAGDTCLRTDRVDEIKNLGPIDIMIAPINGAFGNLNEEECALLSDLLKAKLTIPCHYGMFASHGGNPGLFINEMQTKFPNNKFHLMCLGECITL